MELKDYLHFYIGCELKFKMWPNDSGKLIGIEGESAIVSMKAYGRTVVNTSVVIPILRTLSDMIEEEKTHILVLLGDLDAKFIMSEQHFEIKHDLLKQTRYDSLTLADTDEDCRLGPSGYWMLTTYLLKQGFDLFGLIKEGLAIDATTLKPVA